MSEFLNLENSQNCLNLKIYTICKILELQICAILNISKFPQF